MKKHVPTDADGRQALRDHLIDRASAARERHGPIEDEESLRALLADRSVVRYPVQLEFGAAVLRPGEFAFPEQIGDHPSQGYRLWLHPCFRLRPGVWPALVAYHIPPINFADVVTSDDCEVFAAVLLGMEQEPLYRLLCELADSMPAAS